MDAAGDASGDAAAPPGPRWAAVLIGVSVAAVCALGLPVAFVIAYGFADQVTTFMHVVFLVLSLLLALVATGITWPLLSAGLRYGAGRGLGGALGLVGATYAAALGVGTVVALLNEDQGSVTADQPGAPFVVLVVLCAALVGAGGTAATRVLRTSSPGRSRTYVASPDSKSGGPYRQTNRGKHKRTVSARPGRHRGP